VKSRRWKSSRELELELELRHIERLEHRKAEARRIHQNVRLGVASADELRQVGPPSRIGKLG
jgi:hypothetical protein